MNSICGANGFGNRVWCDSRFWRERADTAIHDGARSGTGADDRRTVANRLRCGCRYAPGGSGSFACMIHLPATVRVYLCLSLCDMRPSFDGLHRAGERSSGTGCVRRTSLVHQQKKRPSEDFVLGPGRICDLGETFGGGQLVIPSAEPGSRRFETPSRS